MGASGNEIFVDIVTKVTITGTTKAVPVVKKGNPLQGECLQISWTEIWDRGLDYHIYLSREAFVGCLEITFGKETKLFCVTLIDEKHKKVLYQYRAENGKCVTESCITLEAGTSTDSLVVTSVITQSDERNLYGRSVRLDALCILGNGTKVNVEVQRSNNDNHLKRARFNASSICLRLRSATANRSEMKTYMTEDSILIFA